MIDFNNAVVIRDNKMTNELRDKANSLINKVKSLEASERRDYFEQLNSLLVDILDNKNKNFKDFTKKVSESPYFHDAEIVSVCDKETEQIIEEIFKILTNKLG